MELEDKTKVIKNNAVGFAEQQHLTGIEIRINQEMMRYHDMEHHMACKWGVGRLLELAPDDLKGKWNTQLSKLNDAIEARDAHTVTGLVDGCIRGLKALDASAVKLGHSTYSPELMECEVDGVTYRIAKTPLEASALNKIHKTTEIMALEELCRVYAQRSNNISKGDVETQQLISSGKLIDDELPF